MRRLRSHLTYANVMSTLAALFALSGGVAYAANTIGSSDIIDGQVKTADLAANAVNTEKIADGQVRVADIGEGGVASDEIKNNAIVNADVAPNSLASGRILDATVTGTDLAGTGFGDNGFNGDEEIRDGTITGFDIANDEIGANHIIDGSLTAGDTSDVFDAGYGSDTSCGADGVGGEVCASTTFTLNQPGVLLVNATGEWRTASSGGDGVEMVCVLQVDGTDIGVAQSIGEGGTNHIASQNGTMALTALSGQLSVGEHTAHTLCSQVNADIDLGDNQITAARVDN